MSLSGWLRKYADSLAPSDKDEARAGRVIARIQDIIHRNLGNRFSIDRIRPLGSYLKKTSIWFTMDIDIVIYLNDGEPPFERFKDALEDVVTMQLDKDCKTTKRGVGFLVEGFEIDLLPAKSFLNQYGYSDGRDAAETQVRSAIQFLRINPHLALEDKFAYSSSLSEGAVKFEQGHSSFSHSLSRLAKYWSLTIGIPEFKFGRSTIMECLGARAAEEEEKRRSQDVLKGFRRFLQMIVAAQSLNIVWENFYRVRDIPAAICQQRPLLLDPTNPYNNLLEGDLGKHLLKMRPFASETLRRLQSAEFQEGCQIEIIFIPQPVWIRVFLTSTSQKLPQNYLVGRESSPLSVPKVETRAGAKGVDSSIAKRYLFSFADAVSAARLDAGSSEITTERVEKKLKEMISPGASWSPSNDRHEDKDMTFNIPVGKDAGEVIKISCDWR